MEFLDFGPDARNDMDFEDISFLEGLSIFCRKGKKQQCLMMVRVNESHCKHHLSTVPISYTFCIHMLGLYFPDPLN